MIREVVDDRLFVGNARDARSLEFLGKHQITAVVDLAAEEAPAMAFRDTLTIRVPLSDDGENREDHIEFAIRAVLRLLTNGERLLVSCSAGQSRSPLIALAATSLCRKTPFEDEARDWLQVHAADVSPALVAQVRAVTDKMRSENSHP